jgi:hypothetical protein
MRPISRIGVCVAAVVAFGAVASSAEAAEVGQCVKAPKVEGKYTGAYRDKNCVDAVTEAQKAQGKKNKYEWEEIFPPPPPGFTSREGVFRLVGPGGFPVVFCESGTDSGKWLGLGADEEHIVYEFCTIQRSSGGPVQPLPNIKMTTRTGILPPLPPPNNEKAFDLYYAEVGEPLMSVEYEPGKIVRLVGEFAGVLSPVNKMTPKFTTTFGEGHGEQALILETSEDGGVTWESSPVTLSAVARDVEEARGKIEIRTK